MQKLFLQYQQGAHAQVWETLSYLGSEVRSLEAYSDAKAVAIETMKRVRYNIGLLLPRLKEMGFIFGYTWLQDTSIDVTDEWIEHQPAKYQPPSSDIETYLDAFEKEVGMLPLSLWAFYHEVGEINFFGTHPSWDHLFMMHRPSTPTTLDPLSIYSLKDEMIDEYREWRNWMQEEGKESTTYHLPIALDYELKYNVSGTGAYEIGLPNTAADGLLLHEWHHTTFVNYLRICINYGGLPGLQFIEHLIKEELEYLRKDLIPF